VSLTLDGSSVVTWGGVASGQVALTTSNADDIIVACVAGEMNPASSRFVLGVTDQGSAGLTFTRLTSFNYTTTGFGSNAFADMEIWWAKAPSPLSSEIIKAQFSAAMDAAWMILFGVTGADQTQPWDTSASFPATDSQPTNVDANMSISGLNIHASPSMLIEMFYTVRNELPTPGSGFTNIKTAAVGPGTLWSSGFVAYEAFTPPQTGVTAAVTGNSQGCGFLVHALRGPTAGRRLAQVLT
jgi:hypothetical protein